MKVAVVPAAGMAPEQPAEVNEMFVTVAVIERVEFVSTMPVANVCLGIVIEHPIAGIVHEMDVGVVTVTLNDVKPTLPAERTQSEPPSVQLAGVEAPMIVAMQPLQTVPVTGIEAVDLLAGVIDPVRVKFEHSMKAVGLSRSLLVPVVVSEIFVLST